MAWAKALFLCFFFFLLISMETKLPTFHIYCSKDKHIHLDEKGQMSPPPLPKKRHSILLQHQMFLFRMTWSWHLKLRISDSVRGFFVYRGHFLGIEQRAQTFTKYVLLLSYAMQQGFAGTRKNRFLNLSFDAGWGGYFSTFLCIKKPLFFKMFRLINACKWKLNAKRCHKYDRVANPVNW